jgi:hypothetical protein
VWYSYFRGIHPWLQRTELLVCGAAATLPLTDFAGLKTPIQKKRSSCLCYFVDHQFSFTAQFISELPRMPRRSSLTVPLAESSRTHRRRRSADDRSLASICTPVITALSESFEPGDSWGHPIALSVDEDEDRHNTTPVIRTPRKTTARDVTAHPLPSSANHSRLQPPTTPIQTRPEVHRLPASDPGPRLWGNGHEIYERTVAYQHLNQLPCGHKQYTHPLGTCARTHQAKCPQCIAQQGQYPELYRIETHQSADDRDEPPPPKSTTTKARHYYCDGSDDVFNDNANGDGKANEQNAARQNHDEMAPMVHHRLIQAAKKKLTGDEKEGYLYIFRHSEKPGLLKLGYSQDVLQRGKQHKNVCGIDPWWVKITDRVENMKRAEKLAKLDMDHLRTDWMCTSCSQKHTEWFRVSEDKAKAVLKRWVTWINEQAPYVIDEQAPCNGRVNIAPIWGWLMDYRRVPRFDFGNDDHEARWAHWDYVLSLPSRKARSKFEEYEKVHAKIQQPSGQEKPLAYRQRPLKGNRDNILRYGRTFVEQAVSEAMDLKRNGDAPSIVIGALYIHDSAVNIGSG